MLMPPTPDEVAKLAELSHRTRTEEISREKQEVPHRSLRRRLSPQTIEALLARYAAGEKTLALSREFGISDSGLRQLLLAEGMSLHGHAMTVEDAETAVQLYGRGMTIKQVVEQIGYSEGTIRTALRKHGVVTRSGGHRMEMESDE